MYMPLRLKQVGRNEAVGGRHESVSDKNSKAKDLLTAANMF